MGQAANSHKLEDLNPIDDDAIAKAKFRPTPTPIDAGFHEALLVGSPENDVRQKVDPLVGKYTSVIGQLQVRDEDGTNYVGSATLVCCEGMYVILTCAHNFVSIVDIGGKVIRRHCKQATFFHGRSSNTTYFRKLVVSKYVIHPNYYKNPTITSGFDIAMAFLLPLDSDLTPQPATDSCFGNWAEKRAPKHIEVCGYPGEKNSEPFGMRGNVASIHEQPRGGRIVVYSDLDTTPGQSGSPVFEVGSFEASERRVQGGKAFRDIDDFRCLFAIHVGYSSVLGGNLATVVTGALFEWFLSCVQNERKFQDELRNYYVPE